MSKLNELKQMSPKLRAAMARRDSIRKHVRKHKSNIAHCESQITRLEEKLVELENTTVSRVAHFKADAELQADYAAKAGVLLKEAQADVDSQLAELEAIKAKAKPTVKQVVKEETVDRLKGQKDKIAQQAGYTDHAEYEAHLAEEREAKAAEAKVKEAEDLEEQIAAAQRKLESLESDEIPVDKEVVVPDVEPAKDLEDNKAPPQRGMSKKQRRAEARRRSAEAKQTA